MKKRLILFALAACLTVLCGASLGEGQPATLRDLNSTDSFTIRLERVLRITGEEGKDTYHYNVQQGACTDGAYGYFILESQAVFKGSIWKVDLTDYQVVDKAFGLEIDHGNDIAYNPKTKSLIVANNKPNYQTLTFVDPETLAVTGSVTLQRKMYSVCYEESRDQYVVGISGSYDFAVLDGEFSEVAYYSGQDTGLVKQGMDCDSQYIYFPQNSQDETVNVIMVYDWEGNYINQIKVKSFQEIESMFHVGEDVYIAFTGGGSHVYRASLTKE